MSQVIKPLKRRPGRPFWIPFGIAFAVLFSLFFQLHCCVGTGESRVLRTAKQNFLVFSRVVNRNSDLYFGFEVTP